MLRNGRRKLLLQVLLAAGLLLLKTPIGKCQNAPATASPGAPPADTVPDVRALADAVRALQAQVQTLNSQVSELRAAEEREHAEARELRSELNRAAAKSVVAPREPNDAYASMSSSTSISSSSAAAVPAASNAQGASLEERVTKLEDNQELTDAKVLDQSQTKVESGSKYRVRLSGMVLLNTTVTRGSVDNLDFPEIATPPETPDTSGAFAGSLRQSQIGIEAFGPDIAGAHTSANVKFDFGGGFPDTGNGAVMGVVRLRRASSVSTGQHFNYSGAGFVVFAPLGSDVACDHFDSGAFLLGESVDMDAANPRGASRGAF